jgi:enoyl-CoA hydratase/carnithine racemase
LIAEIVAPDEVVPRALALAAEIAAEPREAIEGLKRLTALAASGDRAAGLLAERDLVCRLYRSDVGQQRVRAFAARSAAKQQAAP